MRFNCKNTRAVLYHAKRLSHIYSNVEMKCELFNQIQVSSELSSGMENFNWFHTFDTT